MSKPMFEKTGTLIEKLMFLKIFIDRSKGYTNLMMALMLGITMLNSFLDKDGIQDLSFVIWMNNHLTITYIIAALLGIFGLLGVGFIDTKIGARSEEMRNNSLHNPIVVEKLSILRELKQKFLDENN